MQPPLMRYALEEPTSLFAESIRSVRLAVQRAANVDSVKTIMVSSSVDGEGKTTLAVNLALSLAAVGARMSPAGFPFSPPAAMARAQD